jgi:hypothetical protein
LKKTTCGLTTVKLTAKLSTLSRKKTMSTINNETQGLFALDSVEDVSDDSAAAIQGGISVWERPNFTGQRRDLQASPDLVKQGFNDEISSITNNTQKTWAFYINANYSGSTFSLKPGERSGGLGNFNNQISSLRSV